MAVRKLETRARALALQLLYAWDLAENGDWRLGTGGPGDRGTGGPGDWGIGELADGKAPDHQDAWNRVLGLVHPGPRLEELAVALANDVVARQGELDAHIERAADRWRIERLGVIDRNVLRLAAGEISKGDTPPKVVIDEAVRLARWFGGEKSPSFVNGVLDRIARDLGRL